MKNIILVLLVYFSFCCSNIVFGQAASIPETAEYETMESNFTTSVELLSNQQLGLFQKKSKQQIRDWVDLVDLLGSKDWKPELKEKLNQQALSLFSSPSDSLFFLNNKNLKNISVEEYLKKLKTQTTSSTISNMELSEPSIHKENYIWTLTFDLKKQNISKKKFITKFILKKKQKSFGKEVKEVWDVLIQEVREISN